MIRTQIQLTEQQMDSLRGEAEKERISIAELIRRSIDASSTGSILPARAELKRRALAVAGRFASGQTNVSAEHDQYLDEAFAGTANHR